MNEPTEMVRVFIGRAILIIDDEFFEVKTYYDGMKLKKGVGYVRGDYVYIYDGKSDKLKNRLPGRIYKNLNGDYTWTPHWTDQLESYHVKNVTELDLGKIFDDADKHESEFIDHKDIEMINNNTEVWMPTIKEDDDFLKFIIKRIIIDKKVNLRNYRSKFANQFSLNNLKSGLIKDTKMTVPNFKVWCEILGVEWEMTMKDNGTDTMSPLPDQIQVSSEDFL